MKHATELYRTTKGAVWQDNRGRGFWLEWAGEATFFRYPVFQEFLKHVRSIDLDEMVMNAHRHADVAILSPGNCERCFVLTLCEAWALKDLFQGAQTMLELHRIVQDRLYTFALV